MRLRLAALLSAALVVGVAAPVSAQRLEAPGAVDSSRTVVRLGADVARTGAQLDTLAWAFAPGDSSAWAAPAFDDRAWRRLRPADYDPARDGPVGWFRLRLDADSALARVPFGLLLDHHGASEVYADGRLIARFGQPSARAGAERTYWVSGEPVAAGRPGVPRVLAIRYSLHAGAALRARVPAVRAWYGPELGVALAPVVGRADGAGATGAARAYWGGKLEAAVPNAAVGGALGLLALFHLVVFAFSRRDRAHLYVGLLALVLGAQTLTLVLRQAPAFRAYPVVVGLGVANVAFGHALFALLTLVLYATLLPRMPRWSPLLGAAALVLFGASLFDLHAAVPYGLVFVLVPEALRVSAHAWRARRSEGAIVGAAAVGAAALVSAVTLTAFVAGRLTGAWSVPYGPLFYGGFLPIPLAISLVLARRYGVVTQSLRERLVEVQSLTEARTREAAERATIEAESRRKSEELEAARAVQLAMLPAALPQLPFAELAAFMQTASEVGGDYYDAHVGPDGTLTLVVGDATGHGARAGTMVTAAKSLFVTHAGDASLAEILGAMNATIRQLHLRGLYMALLVARLRPDGALAFASAGMPLPVVVRGASGAAEPITVKGPPLGAAPLTFRYAEADVRLGAGDALVLMSDGLPERRALDGTFLGYSEAHALAGVAAADGRSAAGIVRHLTEAGDLHGGGATPDDDVTLLALRFTGGLVASSASPAA